MRINSIRNGRKIILEAEKWYRTSSNASSTANWLCMWQVGNQPSIVVVANVRPMSHLRFYRATLSRNKVLTAHVHEHCDKSRKQTKQSWLLYLLQFQWGHCCNQFTQLNKLHVSNKLKRLFPAKQDCLRQTITYTAPESKRWQELINQRSLLSRQSSTE